MILERAHTQSSHRRLPVVALWLPLCLAVLLAPLKLQAQSVQKAKARLEQLAREISMDLAGKQDASDSLTARYAADSAALVAHLESVLRGQLRTGSIPPEQDLLRGIEPPTPKVKAPVDPFAGQADRLRQARAELDRYKGRLGRVESVRELPRHWLLGLHPLRGAPWRERVVLGALWQAGLKENPYADLAPYVAWRLTDRLSFGAGGQYRLGLSEWPWRDRGERVYGPFAFADYEVKGGVFGRLHHERLRSPVPRLDPMTQAETAGRAWVPGLSVGAGKSFTVYGSLKGYALVQYNLLHEHGRTPFLRPLQARAGFFINWPVRQRSTKE